MILVKDGARHIVLDAAPPGRPCPNCGTTDRVVVVTYQVFGFFSFCASSRRRYAIECRRCATPRHELERKQFESDYGNAVPYAHRFGLGALGALVAGAVVVVVLAGRSSAWATAYPLVALLVGLGVVAGTRRSAFARRRARERRVDANRA